MSSLTSRIAAAVFSANTPTPNSVLVACSTQTQTPPVSPVVSLSDTFVIHSPSSPFCDVSARCGSQLELSPPSELDDRNSVSAVAWELAQCVLSGAVLAGYVIALDMADD